jgi:hypothetical protein
MGLPDPVRVKISSEAAGYVSLTPVVAQELPLRELLEHAAAAVGPGAARLVELLRRGSLVAGASRFRWEPMNASEAEIAPHLAALPRPDPGRPFAAERCEKVWLTSPGARVEFSRAVAEARGFLRRRSFWDALLAEVSAPAYVDYVYRERCDRYRAQVEPAQRAALHEAARWLRQRALERRIRGAAFDAAEFYVRRA